MQLSSIILKIPLKYVLSIYKYYNASIPEFSD